MEVYRGEKRFLSVELAAVLAQGDSLTGTPTVEIVAKRGRTATTMETSSPAAPAIDGTAITFWVDVPDDQERGNYLVLVECATANEEMVHEEAPLIVQ